MSKMVNHAPPLPAVNEIHFRHAM